MKKSAVIVITLLFSVLRAFSQDLKQEIAAMNAYLGTLKSYRMTVAYAAGDSTDFSDEGIASVLVGPEGFFYSTGFAEMIINPSHTIIVNEEDRTLICSENSKGKRRNASVGNTLLEGVDTLVAAADTVYFLNNGDERLYVLRLEKSYFHLVEMSFRGKILEKVVYHYNGDAIDREGVKAVCHVSLEENPEYDPHLLQSDFYFRKSNGSLQPTETFNGYLLLMNESTESYIE